MARKKTKNSNRNAPAEPVTEPATLARAGLTFIKSHFNLTGETDEVGTVKSIKSGIEFRGFNLWTLVFAIFIASVGLNINSTAVIIGAMLISPLMGPIMGAGLAVGIYDFALLRKSLRNLAIATVVSVLTSALFFWISPLAEAKSELLARTTPTIYDVLVALFGGAAGIVAGSRKDKTNAIPGVAIATALMPPLCTAGYGLANGSAAFFFGAMYLYLINCIFICFSTIFFVQFLKFKKVSFVDVATRKRVRNYMLVFALLTITPSVYFAYRLVDQSIFERNSKRFVHEAVVFPSTRVLNYELNYAANPPEIRIALFGKPLDKDSLRLIKSRLSAYDLKGVRLRVDQARAGGDAPGRDVKDIVGDLYKKNIDLIKNKDDRIRLLENELLAFKSRENLIPKVSREISFLFPRIESFSFGDITVAKVSTQATAKEKTVIVRWKRRPRKVDRRKLELYLKSRLGLEKIKILDDR